MPSIGTVWAWLTDIRPERIRKITGRKFRIAIGLVLVNVPEVYFLSSGIAGRMTIVACLAVVGIPWYSAVLVIGIGLTVLMAVDAAEYRVV